MNSDLFADLKCWQWRLFEYDIAGFGDFVVDQYGLAGFELTHHLPDLCL
jgi:hypothetical protein